MIWLLVGAAFVAMYLHSSNTATQTGQQNGAPITTPPNAKTVAVIKSLDIRDASGMLKSNAQRAADIAAYNALSDSEKALAVAQALHNSLGWDVYQNTPPGPPDGRTV